MKNNKLKKNEPDTTNTVSTLTEGNTNTSVNKRARGRRWCLTINNYSDTKTQEILEYFESHNYKYIIGYEGEEKTKHLQIYFESKNPIKFKTIKNKFPRAHIEKAKGNRKQNIKYCSKEGNYKTNFGEVRDKDKEFYERLIHSHLDSGYSTSEAEYWANIIIKSFKSWKIGRQ